MLDLVIQKNLNLMEASSMATRNVVELEEDIYQTLREQSYITKIPLKWIVDKLLRKELITTKEVQK